MKQKKIITFFIALFLAVTRVSVYGDNEINVGYYEFKPLIFKDDNQQPAGLFIDVLNNIALKNKWQLKYVYGSWQEVYQSLLQGKIDLLPCIGVTEKRMQVVDFSAEHLFLDWGVIYSFPGSNINEVFDLHNKRLAVLKGSVYTDGLKHLLDQFDIKARLIEKNTYTEVFQAIKDGDVTAGISTNLTGLQYEMQFNVHRTQIIFSPVKIVYGVKKGYHKDLILALDKEIDIMKKDSASYYYERYRFWINEISFGRIPKAVWIGLLMLVIAGLFLLLWNVTLKRQVRAKTFSLENEVKDRRKAEDDIREEKLKYELLANSGLALIWVSDTSKKCIYFNEPWLKFTGRTLEQELGDGWAEGVHPDDLSYCLEIFSTAFDKRQPFDMEYRLKNQSGHFRWIRDLGTPSFNRQGNFVGYIGHCFDITEKKLNEEKLRLSLNDKEILLKELFHRTKNTMQVISGMVFLQGAEHPENKELQLLVQDTMNRIQSISLVHDMLYKTNNLSQLSVKAYLTQLSTLLLSGYKNSVRFELNSSDEFMLFDTLIPMGLIINELITNSMKHAFVGLSVNEIIRLNFSKNENRQFILRYSDNGKGLPADFDQNTSAGIGIKLINGISHDQLLGEARFFNQNGFVFELKFPDNLYNRRV